MIPKIDGIKLRVASTLRRKAEEALKERQSQLNLVRSEPDMLRLVHELEVHQIELEMQNDELQLAKEQAELATAKYVELYEFAPTGYFILSRKGKIIQLNIAGSQIFGKDRSQLINHPFAFFVSDESRPVFKQFLSRVFNSHSKETCDLSLSTPNSQPMQVHVTGLVEPDNNECFVTMVDISERKRNEKEIIHANEELAFQNEEKAKRAAELVITNRELAFQNEEREKRAAELVIANKELALQNEEQSRRVGELDITNKMLVIRIEENNLLYSEQISINRLIAFQRDRLEEIASLVPGVVYQYRLRPDGTSCFPYSSEAIKQIYRVTPEEVREDATKVLANLHPDDHEGVMASIHVSANELTPWQHEYRVKFEDSTIRTLFGNALPRLEEDGSVLWHGFITDITERKLAENLIKQSEARYGSMIANISDVIGIMGADGLMKYKSANIEKYFGWLPEERIGTSGFSTIHPDDIEQVQRVFYSLLGEDKSVKTMEFRYECKDGSYKPIELTAANLINNPIINGVLLNYRDISDRKAIEQEKLKAETTIRTLSLAINQSPVTVFITDLAGNIESVNPRFTEITGYSSEEVIGKNPRIFKAGDRPDFDYKGLWDTILSGGNWYGIFHNRKKNGELYWESSVISPVKDNVGTITHFLAVKEDITSRLKSEQEIKLKNNELVRLNAEKDKFFSIIAHDLRGPLAGFMGLTEMMADESIEFTEKEKKEMTFDLSRSAKNTFNLLENLLEWSQMDRGLTEFEPQKLELIATVTECRNIVAESARKKRIELIVAISNEPEVVADKNMIQTIIRNLLSNAIKFTPQGGHVTISARPAENNRMVISVKDTGIGMSEKMKNDLFRIDTNTKRPGTEGEQSTGLGLLLCKEFVEKLGGEIWVESAPNQGSVFNFTIPIVGQADKEPSEISTIKVNLITNPILNLNILIAEDDEISARLILAIVKEIGVNISRVRTGFEAVEFCRNNPKTDLVLMDIAMPFMDGYEATRQIRQFNKEVVIIAQTTFGLAADREKAIASGCNDYITKPFVKDELDKLIKRHL